MPKQATKGSFRKGDRRAGRKPGTPNKVTALGRELAVGLISSPDYLKKLQERCDSGKIAPAVEQMLWHYAIGKPKDTLEVSGEGGQPLTFTLRLNGSDRDV